MSDDYDVDVLVVGTGPAGGSMAALLATYGISVMAVSRYGGTARTPRAHITNQRAMEVMRDLGIEQACLQQACAPEVMGLTLWMESLAGREYGRTYAWGHDPARKGEYEAASPCRMSDLPQSLLEPIIVGTATARGAKLRFDTEFLSFVQDDDGVTSTLRDRLTGAAVTIRSRYLIGADGARSRVIEQLGVGSTRRFNPKQAFNIHCKVDLAQYVAHRSGALYWILDNAAPLSAFIGNFRLVRPWNEWLVALIPAVPDPPVPTPETATERLHALIGDSSLPIEILSISQWTFNDEVADSYAVGRVFCMGDAVHRHPPGNGLGSNTAVQDAYNLAWKMALVLRGVASPTLLDSYEAERLPVGRQIVARANKSMDQADIFGPLGVRPDLAPDQRAAWIDRLAAASEEGSAARAALRAGIADRRYELHAHGVELNQRYVSDAIVPDGTVIDRFDRDAELFYAPGTAPGMHLPHCWLGTGPRRDKQISTLDLAGGGAFALFTGIGGDGWVEAARLVADELSIPIAVNRIGFGLDYADLYGDWARLSDIAEDGCLIVRPDMFVAWRSRTLATDCVAQVGAAFRRILGR